MSVNNLANIKELIHDFSEMSLTDFRQALNSTIADLDPMSLQYLVRQLKDYRGNRSMRAAVAGALAELEDEHFLDDFAEVIEFETDVSLCRECIQGISRMGTKDSNSRLDQLSKEKPNATIASLLRQELEKLNQQEPSEYYFENLKKGEKAARSTMAASRVLINIGDEKIVNRILDVMESLDGLGRVEGARVVSQLGKTKHLEPLLPLLEKFVGNLRSRMKMLSELESIQGLEKADRMDHLRNYGAQWTPESHQETYNNFLDQLKEGSLSKAKSFLDGLVELGQFAVTFYVKSIFMLHQNQVASASKFHEEEVRETRVRISRNRQLVAFLAEGIGRMATELPQDSPIRKEVIKWSLILLKFSFNDIKKMTLFGIANFVSPQDSELLAAVGNATQVEGMMRLLRRLGKRQDPGFIDFFLKLAENHQLVDMQELALQALADLPGVGVQLDALFEDGSHASLRTAIRVVGSIGATKFVPRLIQYLENQSDFLRMEVIRSLGKLGDPANLKAIETVLYDAKNLELVEACLFALAEMKNDEAIASLQKFAKKTQNRPKALSALEHIVLYYSRWDTPLPDEHIEFVSKLLEEFILSNRAPYRMTAYAIASRVISWKLEFIEAIRELFKEATSRLRAQSTWDKKEKPLLEKAQKSLNRSYYYLKDAMAFEEKISDMIRRAKGTGGDKWVAAYEKILKLVLESELTFSPSFTLKLAEVVREILPEKTSWREQILVFQLAGASRERSLGEFLIPYLKTVPKQAHNSLVETLNLLGFGMRQIKDLVQINKVILLEGSGFFRKRLGSYLIGLELEVRSFENPDDVENALKEDVPDLLITEATQSKPGDLVSRVVEWKKKFASVEIIVQTNLRDPECMNRIRSLNPLGLLHKPYSMDELKNVIKA